MIFSLAPQRVSALIWFPLKSTLRQGFKGKRLLEDDPHQHQEENEDGDKAERQLVNDTSSSQWATGAQTCWGALGTSEELTT